MFTVRVYDNYNLMTFQDLATYDIEGCEFSKKFRAETSGDMDNPNGMCRTLKSFKLLENLTSFPL